MKCCKSCSVSKPLSEDVAEAPEEEVDASFIDEKEGGACYYDVATGLRTCE